MNNNYGILSMSLLLLFSTAPTPVGCVIKYSLLHQFVSTILVSYTCLACAPRLQAHGSYHEELETVDEHLATAPNDPKLWYRRGFLNVLHGEWHAALVDLEKADRLAPGQLPTDWLRGQALDAGGQPEAAKAVLDDFISHNPDHGGARTSRARVLIKLNQPEAALTDYRLALKHTPNAEPDLVQEVAEVLISQKLTTEASDFLSVHLKRLGNVPSLALKALEIEVALGRFDDALAHLDVLQQSAPRPEPWMAKRAALLAQAGRIIESKVAWKALFDHIQALPNLERGSHAMQLIAEQCTQGLASLQNISESDISQSQVTSKEP